MGAGHFQSFGNAAEKIFPAVEIYSEKLDNTNCNVCGITDRNCNTKKVQFRDARQRPSFCKGRVCAAGGRIYYLQSTAQSSAVPRINKAEAIRTCLHSINDKENFKTEVLEAKRPFWWTFGRRGYVLLPAAALARRWTLWPQSTRRCKVAVGKVNVDEQPETGRAVQ